MNVSKLAMAAAVASLGLGISGGAHAAKSEAYAYDTPGSIVRNSSGLCLRTNEWSPQTAIKECDPALFPEPPRAAAAPVQAAPAPAAPPAPPPVIARVMDSDGDGVPDSADACPGTPAGAHVDARGCELDADRDGVVDRLDKCPGTATGVKVDSVGCEILAALILKGVNFESDSARLTKDSFPVLDAAADSLKKRGDVTTEVAGFTDSRGAEEHNHVLSQRRADAVRAYLISKGIPAAKLSSRGYGEDQPIADNKTAAGRAANRRVELRTQ